MVLLGRGYKGLWAGPRSEAKAVEQEDFRETKLRLGRSTIEQWSRWRMAAVAVAVPAAIHRVTHYEHVQRDPGSLAEYPPIVGSSDQGQRLLVSFSSIFL